MLQSLREETEGKLQMLLSIRQNGLTSLFKEVRVVKVCATRVRARSPRGPSRTEKSTESKFHYGQRKRRYGNSKTLRGEYSEVLIFLRSGPGKPNQRKVSS